MSNTFSTALSALNASSVAINITGNNLANVNTTGFKASTVAFSELVSQTLGAVSGDASVGTGLGSPVTTRQFSQGAVQATGNVLDTAIQGDGFFVVKDKSNGLLYTRAGSFRTDAQGKLVTATGERVQGWPAANGVVNPNGPIGDISLPPATLRIPVATSSMSLSLNLNAGAPDGNQFSAPVEAIDSLGNSHTLTVTFTKKSANTWDYDVTVPGQSLTSGTAGTPSSVGKGAVKFDAQGRLTDPAASAGPVSIDVKGLASGAADLAIKWNLYGSDSTPRITQVAQASALSGIQQDGSTSAELLRVGFGEGGVLVARYSSGKDVIVGQLALAAIANPDALTAVGNNNFKVTSQTAAPVIGLSETGGRGKIFSGSLESSTVDIAREFTNLIQFQRAYQANSRVISVADEISQEVLNLTR